jgi:hypothetical protein
MGWPVHVGKCLQAAGLAAALACLASAASADEASYCVTCANPNQTYRCRVVGDGAGVSDAAKLYCIIRTAKEGHHSSCSAESKTANCPGIEKVYTYDGPSIPAEIASDPRVKSLAGRIAHDQQAFAKPQTGGAPKTLFELGGRAVNASRDSWRNARARIGGTEQEQAAPSASQPPLPLNAPASAAANNAAAASNQVQAPKAAASTAPLAAAPPSASSQNRMQRASSAVGSFARKSMRCMRSLFRDCSEDGTGSQTLQ